MTSIKDNPFHKPNPFNSIPYEKFKHPHLSSSNVTQIGYIISERPTLNQQSRHSNYNWNFNENNFNKHKDFNKVKDRTSRITDFEMKMRLSSVYVVPNDRPIRKQLKDSRIQNPFHRKNLLVNKEQVNNDLEIDLSLYRGRANTQYQPKPVNERRISFGTDKDKESNIDYLIEPAKVISRYVPELQINQTLAYSKTPQETKRNPQETAPKTIEFHRKRFYLNNFVND